MDKCPKCGARRMAPADGYTFIAYNCGSWDFEGGSFVDSALCLHSQLAAANERAGRLEAEMEKLRKAWGVLQHDNYMVLGGEGNMWPAHEEAEDVVRRILGGT